MRYHLFVYIPVFLAILCSINSRFHDHCFVYILLFYAVLIPIIFTIGLYSFSFSWQLRCIHLNFSAICFINSRFRYHSFFVFCCLLKKKDITVFAPIFLIICCINSRIFIIALYSYSFSRPLFCINCRFVDHYFELIPVFFTIVLYSSSGV